MAARLVAVVAALLVKLVVETLLVAAAALLILSAVLLVAPAIAAATGVLVKLPVNATPPKTHSASNPLESLDARLRVRGCFEEGPSW
jgi:hypothetical protein